MAILTETFNGVPGGMNLALPSQELDDTECRYLQDGLVHQPGLVLRRGPLTSVAGMPTFDYKGSGFGVTLDPAGEIRLAVLNGNASNGYFSVLTDDFTDKVNLAWPHPLPTVPDTGVPYRIADIKAALSGGAMVGVSSSYDSNSPNQGLAYWRGGIKANYATGTITVSRGSASVTGSGTSWLTNVTAGMWLFANTDEAYSSTLIGCVKRVDSDTSITLEQVSPYAITAKSYTLQSLRGICPRVVKGRITVSTSSTTVTGANTKFTDQGVGTGTWQLYRASDLAYVGKVSSVTNNTTLVLTANAAVAMSNENFVLIKADGNYDIINTGVTSKVGFLNALYAERQWYANLGTSQDKTIRLWFSDTNDPEGLDLAEFDGDHLQIDSTKNANTPIKALLPTYNALLVFKEDETFAVYGDTPSSFSVRKLEDDGVLSGMAVQPYGAGAIWAGREGIWYFDGIQTYNLTELKLGDYYKSSIRTYDPTVFRMYSMISRSHYFLHIERLTPTVPVVKGNRSTTPTSYTICINMLTRAVSLLTNISIRGSVVLPADSGQKTWFLANDTTKAVICDSNSLFDTSGTDEFECDGTVIDPLTFTGNEITDVVRAAGVQGDGLSNDDSTGVWRATTNYCPNGSFETDITGWSEGTRSNAYAKFGSWSLQWITDGSSNDSVQFYSSTDSFASDEVVTFSAWVRPETEVSLNLQINEHDAADVLLRSTNGPAYLCPAGQWTRLEMTITLGASTANLFNFVTTDGVQPVTTLYIDGVQLEKNTSIATPYVHTDGATATRAGAQIDGDATALLNATQGWAAARLRPGWPATREEPPPPNNYRDFGVWFEWTDAPYDNVISAWYEPAENKFAFATAQTGIWSDNAFSPAQTFAAGDLVTVVVAWTSSSIKISVDGGAFTSVSRTDIPVNLQDTFQLGASASPFLGHTPSWHFDGDVVWFACGTGTLVDADTEELYGHGNETPTVSMFSAASMVSGIWDGESSTVETPPAGPDFYLESKKFDAGDGLRKKLFKQLAVHYLAQGAGLSVDTVIGLNNIGQTSSTTLPQSVYTWDTLHSSISSWDTLAEEFATWNLIVESVFVPRRVKFLKRSQHFAFRVYQENPSLTNVRLGPYQVGYKLQRPGRI